MANKRKRNEGICLVGTVPQKPETVLDTGQAYEDLIKALNEKEHIESFFKSEKDAKL